MGDKGKASLKHKLKIKIKNKKLFWIIVSAAVLLIGAAVALIIIKPWEIIMASRTSGAAEAVMTTKAVAYDGIWDEKRYSDELYYPIGIALQDGNLIVADSMCDRIQIIGGARNIRIGKPGQYGLAYIDSGALVDGYRENAMFMKPSDVAVAPNGDVIIADTGNHVIRRMDADYVITIAGSGKSGYSEGKEREAEFNEPRSVAVDSDGIIYVSDTMNHCIRRIDGDGNVTLYAGTPGHPGYRDGAAAQAQFYEPCGLYISDDGALYVADSANHSIRKIINDTVTTVAGMPGETDRQTGYPQSGYIDGNISEARFNFPRAITMLSDGSLIVADSMNHTVRMITQEDVRTLVGSGMADQYYGSVENMKLTRPEGVCTDGETLYISDTLNNRVVTVPLSERVLEGRPSREKLLELTGISTTSKYAYNGDIRVYIDDQRVDMGRVQPWNTPECIYVPIRPLFEALGATVTLNEKSNLLTVTIQEQDTVLKLDQDYFILKGTAVTTIDEIVRLFPYTFEWYEEFNLIALHIPSYLKTEA